MSQAGEFETFEEFWPFYVREHANPTNRRLHFVGTSLSLATVAYAVLRGKPKALLLAPVAGYSFAWIGHFLVEKNRPATFKYPLWSLRGDFKMFAKMLNGSMDEEVRRVMEVAPSDASPQADGAAEVDHERRPATDTKSSPLN